MPRVRDRIPSCQIAFVNFCICLLKYLQINSGYLGIIEQQRTVNTTEDRLSLHPKLSALTSEPIPAGMRGMENLLLQALDRIALAEKEAETSARRAADAKNLADKRDRALMAGKTVIRLREEALRRLQHTPGQCCGDDDLRDELMAMKEQLLHNPEVTRFASENIELRGT